MVKEYIVEFKNADWTGGWGDTYNIVMHIKTNLHQHVISLKLCFNSAKKKEKQLASCGIHITNKMVIGKNIVRITDDKSFYPRTFEPNNVLFQKTHWIQFDFEDGTNTQIIAYNNAYNNHDDYLRNLNKQEHEKQFTTFNLMLFYYPLCPLSDNKKNRGSSWTTGYV